jgi:hypothetical protein
MKHELDSKNGVVIFLIVLSAQNAWRGMTPRQRESLVDREGTRPNTEAALRRRELVDEEGVLTEWGKFVLYVKDPEAYPQPTGAVLIPEAAWPIKPEGKAS